MYLKMYAALLMIFFYKLQIAMINTIIIEIVDNVFVILLDNFSSSPFSLGVLDERDVAELLVVVTFDVAAIVVVLAIDTDAADVVVVDNGAADVVLPNDTGAAVVVVGFNTQIRLVVRLPLNEMYSLLLHCFQSVQLVPVN
mgnify:CR=1 FL=1